MTEIEKVEYTEADQQMFEKAYEYDYSKRIVYGAVLNVGSLSWQLFCVAHFQEAGKFNNLNCFATWRQYNSLSWDSICWS